MRLTTLLAVAAITAGLPGIAAGSSAYTCSTFEYSAGADTHVNSINNSGEIVGYWTDANGRSHGFLRHAGGTFVPLTGPSGEDVTPEGINNLGQIVTSSYVINTDGTYTTIPQLSVAGYPDLQSRGTGINDNGDIAGEGFSVVGPPGSNGTIFIFRLTPDGQFHILDQQGTGSEPSITVGPMNNAGVIVERARYTDAYLLFPDGTRTMLRSPGLRFDAGTSGGAPFTYGLNNSLETAGNTGIVFPIPGMPFLRNLDGRFSSVDCPEISDREFFVAALNDYGVLAGSTFGPGQSGTNHSIGLVVMPTGEVPHLVICQPFLAFDPQTVGTISSEARIWVGNTGPADLRMGAAYIGAARDTDRSNSFRITHTNCAFSFVGPDPVPFLEPWGDCFVDIAFTPQASGEQTAELYVIGDSPDSPKTVSLSGTGVAP